jgi:hypothetical protein
MSKPAPQHQPVGWRWQFIIAPVTTVVLAMIALTTRDAGTSGNHSSSRVPGSTVLTAEPNPTNSTPPSSAADDPDSSIADSSAMMLGRDIQPTTSETCRPPGFAEGAAWQIGKVKVDDHPHENTYFCNLFSSGTGSLDFELGKSYRQMTVTVGFAQDSKGQQHSVRFEIIGDGSVYLTPPRVLKFGMTEYLKVDVSDVTRLKLRIIEVSGSHDNSAPSRPIWASPIVTSVS